MTTPIAPASETWPTFTPHPDNEAYCYVCGEAEGAHGADADHCPPAILASSVPIRTATEQHLDAAVAELRSLAAVLDTAEWVRDVRIVVGAQEHATRLRQIADEIEPIVKAYPSPGLADKAFGVLADVVRGLVYDNGPGDLTDDDLRLLALYVMIDRAKSAGTQSMIGGLLGAFAPAVLGGNLRNIVKRATDQMDKEEKKDEEEKDVAPQETP